jgi:hypothetical protein
MQQTRKLKESSWLAQTLADMLAECDQTSSRGLCIDTLKDVVTLADRGNHGIYYETVSCERYIVIQNIPSELQNGIRGLAEKYKDDNGQYIVSALMTHDLNSAKINVSKLMYQIRNE